LKSGPLKYCCGIYTNLQNSRPGRLFFRGTFFLEKIGYCRVLEANVSKGPAGKYFIKHGFKNFYREHDPLEKLIRIDRTLLQNFQADFDFIFSARL
jgi:hypothetical protein